MAGDVADAWGAPGQGPVHQVVFRWSERPLAGSARGLGPVASSLDPPGLELWTLRLRDLVWAAPENGVALSYLDFGEAGAVVRRVDAKDTVGRGSTFAHVLVGPDLSAELALGLGGGGWPGWFGPDTPLPGNGVLPWLERAELIRAADESIVAPDGLRARARALPGAGLADIVAAALADPAADLTVAPGELDRTVLMFALLDLLGQVYPGPYSFSTFAAEDTGPAQPRLLLLAGELEYSMRQPTRTRILRPGGEPADGARPDGVDLAGFARAWCDSYRLRGLDALCRLLPEEPLRDAREVAAWVRRSWLAPGVLNDPVVLLARAENVEALTEAERAVLAQGFPPDDVAAALGDYDSHGLRGLAVAWRIGSPAYELNPAIGMKIHTKVLDALLSRWEPEDAEALCTAVGDPAATAERIEQWAVSPARHAAPLGSVLAACDILEIPAEATTRILATLLEGFEPHRLLGWISENALAHPGHARTVTSALSYPGDSGSWAVAETADRFADTGGLRREVEAMADGDAALAAVLFERVVAYFGGGHIDSPAYLERLLGGKGARSAPLIWALCRVVTSQDAKQALALAVWREYFAGNHLGEPAPMYQPTAPASAPYRIPAPGRVPVQPPGPVGPPVAPSPTSHRSYAEDQRRRFDLLLLIVIGVIAAVAVFAVLALAGRLH